MKSGEHAFPEQREEKQTTGGVWNRDPDLVLPCPAQTSEPLQCSFLSLTKGGGCFPLLNFWRKDDLCRRLAMLSRCRMSNGERGTGSCLGVSLEFQSSERVSKLLHWCYSPLLLPHVLGNLKGCSTQTYRLQVNQFPISDPKGNQNQDLYE